MRGHASIWNFEHGGAGRIAGAAMAKERQREMTPRPPKLWCLAEEGTEMAAQRLSMRRVREILRYRFAEGLGHKTISYQVGAAPSTVRETLRRAAARLMWPLDEAMTDAVLEAALHKASGKNRGHPRSMEQIGHRSTAN